MVDPHRLQDSVQSTGRALLQQSLQALVCQALPAARLPVTFRIRLLPDSAGRLDWSHLSANQATLRPVHNPADVPNHAVFVGCLLPRFSAHYCVLCNYMFSVCILLSFYFPKTEPQDSDGLHQANLRDL